MQVWKLANSVITPTSISPLDFGLPLNPLASVRGGQPAENAAMLTSLLAGELPTSHPVENFVVLNSAALLLVAGKVSTAVEGVALARKSIATGQAKAALDAFRTVSQAFSPL